MFCIPISRVIPVFRLLTSQVFSNNLCIDSVAPHFSPSISLWPFPANKVVEPQGSWPPGSSRKQKEEREYRRVGCRIIISGGRNTKALLIQSKVYTVLWNFERNPRVQINIQYSIFNRHVYIIPRSQSSRSFRWSLVTSVPFMISVSSSSTLRAARKLFAEPVICLEHRWTWTASQKRGYTTERPASEKPCRQPPQPVPTTTQLRPRTNLSPPESQVKPNPSNGNEEKPKRLLRPHVLSKRLSDLASQGQLDQAVDTLQNSPLDASNVATWNTILLHCMMENRFKLGYKLFTDVRIPLPLQNGREETDLRCFAFL